MSAGWRAVGVSRADGRLLNIRGGLLNIQLDLLNIQSRLLNIQLGLLNIHKKAVHPIKRRHRFFVYSVTSVRKGWLSSTAASSTMTLAVGYMPAPGPMTVSVPA